MIYELGRDVEDLMRGLKFPVRIDYGRRVPTPYPHGLIMLERDVEGGDALRSVAFERNPRKVIVRDLGARALIYARSPLAGAHRGDHERECETLVDGFLCAVDTWLSDGRTGVRIAASVQEARYVRPEELELSEELPGVLYLVRFRVPRAVLRRAYDGACASEYALASVSTAGILTLERDDGDEVFTLPLTED